MSPQAYLIDFLRFKSPHTSENIQHMTEEVLERFDMKKKVFRIITDNASSMIKAYKFGLSFDGGGGSENVEVDEQSNQFITDIVLMIEDFEQKFQSDNLQMANTKMSVVPIAYSERERTIISGVGDVAFAHHRKETTSVGEARATGITKNGSVLHRTLMMQNNALGENNEWYTVPIHTRIQDSAALAAVGGDDSAGLAAIRAEFTNMEEIKIMTFTGSPIA
ncbi:unnamed protein product [Rotaria sordida]|uniref:DUF659 domain-containing protein n=1 Tax=Rotaria sordida TaxID=392033 RepID=A0A814ZCJ0_9BILA|nr:unnamed protein product [Rotaria sordida]CAF1564982.1 unnamed protein product [Rotaria sordida]